MIKTVDFNSIYDQNYRRSFLFVKSYVHDAMAAEDIVSESLVKYWKLISLDEVEVSDSLLITILKHKSLDYLKHEMVRMHSLERFSELKQRELQIRLSSMEACNPESIYSDEIQTIVDSTLATLPLLTQQIFKMSRFENKSVQEIASETSLTQKGVEYHITKSLKALRSSLKDYLPLFYFLFM